MKNIKLIIVLTIAATITSCKNKKNESSTENQDKKAKDDIVLEQEEVVDELPNLSDINFAAALQSYQAKQFDKAASYITNGVNELKQESANLDAENKKLLDESILKINKLATHVKKGNQDIVTLAQAFGNAEMLVSHDYFTYTVSTLLKEPTKGSYFFSKALRSLKNAVVILEGDAKKDAKAIEDESKKLVAKVKNGVSGLDKDIKTQTKKIKDFLEKHKTELF